MNEMASQVISGVSQPQVLEIYSFKRAVTMLTWKSGLSWENSLK